MNALRLRAAGSAANPARMFGLVGKGGKRFTFDNSDGLFTGFQTAFQKPLPVAPKHQTFLPVEGNTGTTRR